MVCFKFPCVSETAGTWVNLTLVQSQNVELCFFFSSKATDWWFANWIAILVAWNSFYVNLIQPHVGSFEEKINMAVTPPVFCITFVNFLGIKTIGEKLWPENLVSLACEATIIEVLVRQYTNTKNPRMLCPIRIGRSLKDACFIFRLQQSLWPK